MGQPGLIDTAETEVSGLQPGISGQSLSHGDLFRIDVDPRGPRSSRGGPAGDVTQPASELDEFVPGGEAGPHQQLSCPVVVNFADHPQPIVVAASVAQNVPISDG